MPAKRTTMRKIREILRLRLAAGLSIRQISASTKVSVGAIQKLLAQAQALGLEELGNEPGRVAGVPEDDALPDGRTAEAQRGVLDARWRKVVVPESLAGRVFPNHGERHIGGPPGKDTAEGEGHVGPPGGHDPEAPVGSRTQRGRTPATRGV